VPSACRVGGYSWLNYFDTATACGSVHPLTTDLDSLSITGVRTAESLVVGVSIVQIGGKVLAIVQFSDGTTKTFEPTPSYPPPVGRRVTWREVIPQ
jgi:hypothetical protein